MRNGADLLIVRDLLGHGSLEVTKRYAHPAPEKKRDAVNSIVIRKNEIEPTLEIEMPLPH
jgi:site-specific recombinase XerD